MPLEPGHAYVARGDWHLRVERSSGQLKCRLTQDELTSGHRPSVDVLFESVAQTVGAMAVGAILTGMGRDGARGLKMMRDAGAYTVGPVAVLGAGLWHAARGLRGGRRGRAGAGRNGRGQAGRGAQQVEVRSLTSSGQD